MKSSAINNLDELGLDIKTEGDEKMPLVHQIKSKGPAKVIANTE